MKLFNWALITLMLLSLALDGVRWNLYREQRQVLCDLIADQGNAAGYPGVRVTQEAIDWWEEHCQ